MSFNVSMMRLIAALDAIVITSVTGYHNFRQMTREKTMEIHRELW